jgi:protein-L-isoaspartate(D-aspartate) O-methyltransferase
MTRDRTFQKPRSKLVAELRDRGISNERVLNAIGHVPRHSFVDDAFLSRAYWDEALPIGLDQTISQPFTVAFQTMLLDPQPDERILEIGTGSGYQAAILCEMGARVFTIERLQPLFDRTTELLRRLGYRAVCRLGDGTQGWEAVAPFDGIIVTAGATDVPEPLLEQLRLPDESQPGGRLIIPVGDRDSQNMLRIWRRGPDEYEREETEGFRFVPLIPDN